MPELTAALLRAYSHFACRGYRDAGLLLAAAVRDDRAFARAALEAFLADRELAGEDATVAISVVDALDEEA
ncbi:hypothetical protein NET02_16345 [Thermomicrobiaceae bacterium CFH 74404]|uniref:Uncharacterized protein n=1 Tax=Thermalbibacter longus TaxID=2951981 RepID=A0AA42BEF0_9BACT|nr:hypothetical protein [Thermalbibacter longus]MCM8750708.1 hypothetical protein [Thermalbibacter longus]